MDGQADGRTQHTTKFCILVGEVYVCLNVYSLLERSIKVSVFVKMSIVATFSLDQQPKSSSSNLIHFSLNAATTKHSY